MIFDHDELQLQLLDVLYFDDRAPVAMRTRARPFCALSLRINGDASIDLKNETVSLKTHDLAFFPANVGYMRRARRDNMIVFHFNITNCVTYELEVLHEFEFETLLPMFEEALSEWQRREPGYRYRAAAILYRVFAAIRERLGEKPEQISPPISAALETISGKLSDVSLSVAGLAEAAHMSETWFRKQFRRDMGVSPKKYITDLRLEHAQSLLNAGYDTVAGVAEKVGFRDAKNFATAFKKRFGYPPSAQSYAP